MLIGEDDCRLTIGEKRNDLLYEAEKDPEVDYVAFVDDDDLVADHYVQALQSVLVEMPDAVGFWSMRTFDNGRKPIRCRYSWADRSCGERTDTDTGEHYIYRPIMHINPVSLEIALSVMYKPMSSGEDLDYAERLMDVLGYCVTYQDTLYHYHVRSDKPEMVNKA